MSTSITARLSQLRREKGVSQKEAAAGLGISQALLSHYENGIRECGLDFLCRAADYYNVTADYLLGRSESKRGFEGAFGIQSDLASDSELCTLTIFRAAGRMRKYLSFTHESKDSSIDTLHRIYSLLMYRIIIAEAAKGNLPHSWVPNVDSLNSETYLHLLDGIEGSLIKNDKTSSRPSPENIPMCFKTIVSQSQQFLIRHCRANGIEISDDYITKL